MIYNKITLHDKQKVNYLFVTKQTATSTEIAEANATDFEPTWDTFEKQQILCPYVNNLVSSYIIGLINPLTGFIIYRQKIGDSRLYKVAEVDENTTSIIDYLVSNNKEYKWTVVPITDDELGTNMSSETIKAQWDGISLISLKEISTNIYVPDETWVFLEDITPGAIAQNIDVAVNKTYAKHPKTAVGKSNFKTGNITCRLSKIYCNGSYDSSNELYEAWTEFVASGKPFLFRDTKGLMFMAQITDIPTMQYVDGYINGMTDDVPQYHQISFAFTEISGTENITVYEPVEDT